MLEPTASPCQMLNLPFLLQRSTNEIPRIINTSAAFVRRNLRVRAQWPSPIHLSVRPMGGDDLIGCFSFFDPLLECRHRVEAIWSLSSAAMLHARHHEQTQPIGLCRR